MANDGPPPDNAFWEMVSDAPFWLWGALVTLTSFLVTFVARVEVAMAAARRREERVQTAENLLARMETQNAAQQAEVAQALKSVEAAIVRFDRRFDNIENHLRNDHHDRS